eukprot:MONOS_3285.1-p1 / transcript=MONOS_3285.1 / gene=MONOS_3285 / organism=Monocercomonoides_exilis_PA203 / gene_product=unspecified product / transcript_product=unspecified product / location=Mono_scaffold00076:41154-42077(+) / protein_length=222 / sequence_SO=supercontig / SO=protein_coding / is_pseudo=false
MGKKRDEIDQFKGLVLGSHKGWADFFIQLAIAFLMPFGALAAFIGGNLIFFKRSSSSKNQTVEELEQKMKKTGEKYRNCVENINPRLLIYPEGHRRAERTIQRIRTGTFRIAFQLKMPVMIIPGEGSQNAIREKSLFIHSANISINPDNVPEDVDEAYVGCSDDKKLRGVSVLNFKEVIDPAKFEKWEDFYDVCEKSFREGYAEVCEIYDQITKGTTAALLE